jgi:predicted dehydrogenase
MKVGIIGSGFGLYGLLPAFVSTDGCQVVSVCGKKTERLTSYCSSVGITSIYSDWQEMLNKEVIEALAIAVPPDAQYVIAKAAMQKGIHIFAEKPLSATYEQAEELLSLAQENNIITAVDFIFPEIPAWEKVKQLLDDEVYGSLNHISVVWNFLSFDLRNHVDSWKTDSSRGGGALSFFMSHTLHYLEYFAGPISNLQSNYTHSLKSKNNGEVGVDLLVSFDKKIKGTVQMSCNAVGLQNHRIQLLCERATLVLESKEGVVDAFSVTLLQEGKDAESIFSPIEKSYQEDERVTVVKKIALRFIQGVIHQKEIKPSFVEGVRVQSLIETIRNNTA